MRHGRLATDPAEAYIPIFEALSWAAALDERLATDFAPDPNKPNWSWREHIDHGEVVAGFRFARHRAHHQWAEMLYVTGGAALPALLPMPFFEWCWRRELPPGRDRRGEDDYAKFLADVPARFTLETLRDVFKQATSLN
jgi:hypothetical protein